MKDFDAERLIEDMRARDYREAYAEGFLNSWISHQLTIVRRQRELTQSQLAERVGTRQPGIARMERDDYGRWSLPTLQRIAFALGCRLKVSFETFGSLVDEVAKFSELALQRPTFEQDVVFFPSSVWTPHMGDPGPLGEFRRRFVPWLVEQGPLEHLAEWLQGYDLPPVGDEVTPEQWLLDALVPGDQKQREELARRVERALVQERWDVTPPGTRKEDLVRNLFRLAEGLRAPAILGDALWHVCQRRELVALTGSDHPWPGHPLARAVLVNQPGSLFRDFWATEFLGVGQRRPASELPDLAPYGLLGLANMGIAPDVGGIVDGARLAAGWPLSSREIVDILAAAFKQVWSAFAEHKWLSMHVLTVAEASSLGWSALVNRAWTHSVEAQLPMLEAGEAALADNAHRIAQID